MAQSMTCNEREQDLLLWVHQELPPTRRLLTEFHLRRCTTCQQQVEKMRRLSRAVASNLREPHTPAVPVGQAPPLSLPALIASGTVVLFLVGYLVSMSLYSLQKGKLYFWPAGVSGPAISDDGCTPGLPNDRCR